MKPAWQLALLSFIVTLGCGLAPAHAAPPSSAVAIQTIALPGAPASGVFMDYLAYDRAHHRVWVPAGNTGRVDVIDVTDNQVAEVDGFATTELERHGQKRVVGPSSATVGDGVVYVGNRGDSSVCAVDAKSLRKGACVKLDSMPDGIAYVASAKEVWVTTPRDRSIVVLDAASPGVLKMKTKLTLAGQPEGYAVDNTRGLFYTNLEDRDRTLTIAIKSRKVTRTWLPHCGQSGPKGLALDPERDFLFVACPDHVEVLDAGHGGKQLSKVDTGLGVDNIDYVPARHQLFAAAGRDALLTVALVGADGILHVPRPPIPTAPGARNAVATDDGVAYLTDSRAGKILVVPTRHRR